LPLTVPGYSIAAGETNHGYLMGIGTSIFLIAVGAILRWAITDTVEGVNLDVVGLILIIAGAAGLLLSLLWMTIYADRRRGTVVERDVVSDRPVVRERDVV
jgi:hypothetical protein